MEIINLVETFKVLDDSGLDIEEFVNSLSSEQIEELSLVESEDIATYVANILAEHEEHSSRGRRSPEPEPEPEPLPHATHRQTPNNLHLHQHQLVQSDEDYVRKSLFHGSRNTKRSVRDWRDQQLPYSQDSPRNRRDANLLRKKSSTFKATVLSRKYV